MIIAVNFFQYTQLERRRLLHSHLQLSSTTAVQKKWIISYTSHHFTPHGRYELNKLTSLPMCGFIAQLVEQRTGNAEVTGSNPVEAPIFFFRLILEKKITAMIILHSHLQPQLKRKLIISYPSHSFKIRAKIGKKENLSVRITGQFTYFRHVCRQVAQARNMSIGEHRNCCVTFEI